MALSAPNSLVCTMSATVQAVDLATGHGARALFFGPATLPPAFRSRYDGPTPSSPSSRIWALS
jgi:hypothetical protein